MPLVVTEIYGVIGTIILDQRERRNALSQLPARRSSGALCTMARTMRGHSGVQPETQADSLETLRKNRSLSGGLPRKEPPNE